MTVAGLHTYFVDAVGTDLLVHNASCESFDDIVTDDEGSLIGKEDSSGVRLVTESEIREVRRQFEERFGPPASREVPGKGVAEYWEVDGGKINFRGFSSSDGKGDIAMDFAKFDGLGMKRLHLG